MQRKESHDLIIKLRSEGVKTCDVASEVGCSKRNVRRVWAAHRDITSYNPELQAVMDETRVNKKKLRQDARIYNVLSELTKDHIDLLKNMGKYLPKTPSFTSAEGISPHGIIHISDTHFNELTNSYDFTIAAKRLQKFADRAKSYFQIDGIKEVAILLTGDLLNSDRRLDEILNQSTNRSKASILGAILLEQFIRDIAADYKVTVASVSGNEGRVGQEYGNSDIIMSYNYDFTIVEMCRLMHRELPITYIDGGPSEQIININGMNILILHGNCFGMNAKKTTKIQSIIGKYSLQGIKVDYALFGHLHSCSISDTYSRCASLVGSNDYSDKQLQLYGRASQNVHKVFPDGSMENIRIDLENTDGYGGYEIIKDLVAYSAKSAGKVKSMKIPKI
jgi:predicted phosphodiesterase